MTTDRRLSNNGPREKFPDFDSSTSQHLNVFAEDGVAGGTSGRASRQNLTNSSRALPAWQARKESHLSWSGTSDSVTTRGHRKSLGDAFRTIRTRRASVGENAHELVEALKAPLSMKLVSLCLAWYMSSAITSTSSKSILMAFPKPITLTILQFASVSIFCLLLGRLAQSVPQLKRSMPALRHGIRYPNRQIIMTSLPLALFQIIGHILSSTATEKVPVSLVHTIKGLSPLFTVLAYRFLFDIRYGTSTYLALVPLTLGVILSCSVEFSGNTFGILCAFGSTIVFVSQNLFSKKLFNEAARAEADHIYSPRQLDKLNLLCYSAGLAFLLTFPIWLWTDALPLYSAPLSLHAHNLALPTRSSMYLPLEFFFNGLSHFAQNLLAFILLSMTSPVTYSVASQIKRVFVIIMAILWFGNSTTSVQALGIALTFFGLYLYDRANETSKADRKAREGLDRSKHHAQSLLPTIAIKDQHRSTVHSQSGTMPAAAGSPPPEAPSRSAYTESGTIFVPMALHSPTSMVAPVNGDKKSDDAGSGRPSAGSPQATSFALMPGTKQESTWKLSDHKLLATGQ